MIQFVKAFYGDEKAATAIEYGLIAAGIAIAIIAAVGLLGDSLSNMFNDIGDQMTISQ